MCGNYNLVKWKIVLDDYTVHRKFIDLRHINGDKAHHLASQKVTSLRCIGNSPLILLLVAMCSLPNLHDQTAYFKMQQMEETMVDWCNSNSERVKNLRKLIQVRHLI